MVFSGLLTVLEGSLPRLQYWLWASVSTIYAIDSVLSWSIIRGGYRHDVMMSMYSKEANYCGIALVLVVLAWLRTKPHTKRLKNTEEYTEPYHPFKES
jgi:uncharacterized membrane protein YhaH (DUF805 family)